MSAQPLFNASLGHIRQIFSTLEPVEEQQRSGFFRASFIGPWWLRISAMPSIALSGLVGWQGKKFLDPFHATNVLQTTHGTHEKLSMTCQSMQSLVDGKNGVALFYGQDAVKPWCWVVDEMRLLDEHTFLCMTVIDLPLLRALSFPFILRREA